MAEITSTSTGPVTEMMAASTGEVYCNPCRKMY